MTGPDAVAAGSARRLRAAAAGVRPRAALLLGSGWGAIAGQVASAVAIPYAELPGFPALAVDGHAARVLLGRLGGCDVAVLCGRQHAYESGRADAMSGAIRALAALGCEMLLQTNAAGSLDEAMRPGDLMLVADHLNLPQLSPLVGEPGNGRFVDLRDAYDPVLRRAARAAAARVGVAVHEGVYAWVLGPQFETPAEIRMLRQLGARAVGMSTVPETILARHQGLRVIAISMITNMACGMDDAPLSHEHTLAAAAAARGPALRLVEAVLQEFAASMPGTAPHGAPGSRGAPAGPLAETPP